MIKRLAWMLIPLLLITGCKTPTAKKLEKRQQVRAALPPPPLPPGLVERAAANDVVFTSVTRTNANLYLRWTGPAGSVYQLQSKTNVTQSTWANVGSESTNTSAVVPINKPFAFYRLSSAAQTAPPGTIQWVKTIQGTTACSANASAVAADSAGNIVSVGRFQGTMDLGNGNVTSAGSSDDIFIVKYNSAGGVIWVKPIGSNGSDIAYAVAIDSQDNIVVTGSFQQTVSFGSGNSLVSAGGSDIFVAKYNSANPPGLLWAKRMGGTWDERGTGIALATNNDVFISAAFASQNANFDGIPLTIQGNGAPDVVLARMDRNDGHALWARAWGGIDEDTPNGIAVDGSGSVWVAGRFYGVTNLGGGARTNSDPNNVFSDMFIAKYSGSNGDWLYSRTMGGTGGDSAYGIAYDPTFTNIVITGAFKGSTDFGGGAVSSGNGTAAFLAGYSSSGNYRWMMKWGGDFPSSKDNGLGLAIDKSRNLAVTGISDSLLNFGDGWMTNTTGCTTVKFTSNSGTAPTYNWAKRANSINSQGNGIAMDTLGHVVAVGQSLSRTDFGGVSGGIITPYLGAFAVQHLR